MLGSEPSVSVSVRSVVAVSLSALVIAAALVIAVLAPRSATLPRPLPGTGVETRANGELISVEGPLLNNLTLPTLR